MLEGRPIPTKHAPKRSIPVLHKDEWAVIRSSVVCSTLILCVITGSIRAKDVLIVFVTV